MFRDRVVARSRKGKAGQIVVHSLGGIHKNAAARTAQKFEKELTEGKDDILEKLEASGASTQAIMRVKANLIDNPRWSFARAVAEAGADLATTIDAYAKGCIALNKFNAVRTMYQELPSLLRDIMKHAIDQEEDCATCFGIGMVKSRPNAKKLSLRCPSCKGSGKTLVSSPHKQFAIKQALELSRALPEKTPLVAVQQNQTNISGGGEAGLLEKMSKAADELLYNRPASAQVVDAEVIKEDKDGE
jgi:DnaJ-class molecular chaperone